jgi:hypothetical protein
MARSDPEQNPTKEKSPSILRKSAKHANGGTDIRPQPEPDADHLIAHDPEMYAPVPKKKRSRVAALLPWME